MPSDFESPGALATAMTREFRRLSQLTTGCCIYRVSDRLRQVNEKAYTPQMVSIGPLHHGSESLRAMEEHKTRFLWDYVARTETGLSRYVEQVWKSEAKLRSSYAEPLRFSTAELVRIALVDAAFLIEVLLRNSYSEFQKDHDRIFKKPWLIQDISPDIFLLENQLPFFIVTDLFDAKKTLTPSYSGDEVSIPKLLHSFLKEHIHFEGTAANLARVSGPDFEVAHFVDFLRSLNIPEESVEGDHKVISVPSITDLYEAGVKFRAAGSQNMFGFRFSDGVLEVPKLTISGESEQTIRNLLAFEQCHCEGGSYLNDYAVMMDRLINTAKDVDLLIQHGIVENRLGDSSEAANLMNKLGDGATIVVENFYFASISTQLEAYSKVSWHRWWTKLMQEYFNTPWSIASVIAACLLISLTILQATVNVLSLISEKHSHRL